MAIGLPFPPACCVSCLHFSAHCIAWRPLAEVAACPALQWWLALLSAAVLQLPSICLLPAASHPCPTVLAYTAAVQPHILIQHPLPCRYVPYVGDSKRAMDEYTSEIFMGGRNTIVMHNTCEDSLLAAPIILDLVLLAELTTRIQVQIPEGALCAAGLLSYACAVGAWQGAPC